MRLEWTQILTEHAKSFFQFSQFYTRFLHQAKKNDEYVTKFETISTQYLSSISSFVKLIVTSS